MHDNMTKRIKHKKNGSNTYFHEKYGEEKPRFANA